MRTQTGNCLAAVCCALVLLGGSLTGVLGDNGNGYPVSLLNLFGSPGYMACAPTCFGGCSTVATIRVINVPSSPGTTTVWSLDLDLGFILRLGTTMSCPAQEQCMYHSSPYAHKCFYGWAKNRSSWLQKGTSAQLNNRIRFQDHDETISFTEF